MAAVLGCETLSPPPRGSLLLATGLGAFPLLSRTGVHQARTEAFLSETTWVTWRTWGFRCRPESSRGQQGQGGRGLSGPPFSEGKAWSCRTCVPALVTHVTSHLDTLCDVGVLRLGTLHGSSLRRQQLSKMASQPQRVCVVVTSCHVLLCSRRTAEAGPGWAGFRGSFPEDWHVQLSLNHSRS